MSNKMSSNPSILCPSRASWDSDFFQKNIYRISLSGKESTAQLKEAFLALINLDFDLCYLELPLHTAQKFEDLLPDNPIDIKTTFMINLSCSDRQLPDNIYEISESSNRLYDLALVAGNESRFSRDRYFPEDEFVRLYKAWVDNSLAKQIADCILGYYENEKLKGFVSVKIDGEEASIGLLAVDPETHRQGIGSKLMEAAKSIACRHNCKKLLVATQQRNINACNFYKKAGFSLCNETAIYHIWNKKSINWR